MYSLIIFYRFFLLYLAKVEAKVLMAVSNKIRVKVTEVSILASTRDLLSSLKLLSLKEFYSKFFQQSAIKVVCF